MSKLHGWVFTFNQYTNKWYAAKREDAKDLFSNLQSENVIGSSSMKTLQEIISKFGSKKAVEAICK